MLAETKSRFNQKKRALYELPLVPEVFEENEMSLVNQYVKDKYYVILLPAYFHGELIS